jgi:hypothetical protein
MSDDGLDHVDDVYNINTQIKRIENLLHVFDANYNIYTKILIIFSDIAST